MADRVDLAEDCAAYEVAPVDVVARNPFPGLLVRGQSGVNPSADTGPENRERESNSDLMQGYSARCLEELICFDVRPPACTFVSVFPRRQDLPVLHRGGTVVRLWLRTRCRPGAERTPPHTSVPVQTVGRGGFRRVSRSEGLGRCPED